MPGTSQLLPGAALVAGLVEVLEQDLEAMALLKEEVFMCMRRGFLPARVRSTEVRARSCSEGPARSPPRGGNPVTK